MITGRLPDNTVIRISQADLERLRREHAANTALAHWEHCPLCQERGGANCWRYQTLALKAWG